MSSKHVQSQRLKHHKDVNQKLLAHQSISVPERITYSKLTIKTAQRPCTAIFPQASTHLLYLDIHVICLLGTEVPIKLWVLARVSFLISCRPDLQFLWRVAFRKLTAFLYREIGRNKGQKKVTPIFYNKRIIDNRGK